MLLHKAYREVTGRHAMHVSHAMAWTHCYEVYLMSEPDRARVEMHAVLCCWKPHTGLMAKTRLQVLQLSCARVLHSKVVRSKCVHAGWSWFGG